MRNHWSHRLKEACERQGLSYAQLSRATGISSESINKYIQGAVDQPRGNTIDILADTLKVSKFWLLYGIDNGDHSLAIPLSPSQSDVHQVPFYGFKAGMGGGGVIAVERPETYWPIPVGYLKQLRLESSDLIAIVVEGDSMSPTLESGDQVLINRSDRNPAGAGIFAIHDNDTLVVKRVEKIPSTEPARLKLISDNPHHGTYEVLADDTNILGRVVWFARRI